MNLNHQNITSEPLGHLGLVAATIKKLGIDKKIDERLHLDKSKGGIVPYGTRVAAMILNGLGFFNNRLYMTPHFFNNKPGSQLLGEGITESHLNDDSLGRCLDRIAGYGTTKLFSEIAFEIAKEQGLLGKRNHLDTTSFSLYGNYDDRPGNPTPMLGYSKDHRPDLKQVVLSLTQTGPADMPIWMEPLDGNESDKKSFQETVRKIQAFYKEVQAAPDGMFFVVDAAFYVPEKLAELNGVKWITRVPANYKEAQKLLKSEDDEITWQQVNDSYRIHHQKANLGGISQRWILVSSQAAYKKELKTFLKRIDKKAEALQNQLWHISNQVFACESDAKKEARSVVKNLKYHDVVFETIPLYKHAAPGRPKDDAEKVCVGYKLVGTLTSDLSKVNAEKCKLGRFILATNEIDNSLLKDEEILMQYKEQSSIETGFRFMKDSRFELNSFYLQTPERIGAVMMIMTLCLMVYNFAQYGLRQALKNNNDVLPNQVGKPVKNPTMRWIFQLMSSISVVQIEQEGQIQRVVTNMRTVQKKNHHVLWRRGKTNLPYSTRSFN